MICPFCKLSFTSPPALSRADNTTLICPCCGTREALETLAFSQEKIDGILHAIYDDRANDNANKAEDPE